MLIADLHIHSRYSRATSRECTPEHLELWARKKGIQIVGSGDFTHPAWREELKEKLKPAEDGMYVLKKEYRLLDDAATDAFEPRFVITGEISSIYKKNGRVRKVHSLLILPGLEAAEKIAEKLEEIGNIHSDGRPILGVDCRDLLEIVLEICPNAMYVPAHIWTPHFSLFGAFSGFDTVEECFEDLSAHIHAMETGLSSDPPMNWRISALDGYQLLSNSDAHSPAKLGREANMLDIELSYAGLYKAIQQGEGLVGTIEFFPEEGKYHMDGHRKCNLCLTPLETEKYKGICPVCGRKITIGVSHRVEQLADRAEGFIKEGAKPFESLVPLPEVIGASMGYSAASVKVQKEYQHMLHCLGSEFEILRTIPAEEIMRVSGRRLAEGIERLRSGKVERIPGFDGEYGTIQLFDAREIEELDGQMSFFDTLGIGSEKPRRERMTPVKADKNGRKAEPETIQAQTIPADRTKGLNSKQKKAVETSGRDIAVSAGPGTGKTKTLVSRIVYLLKNRKVKPSEITAVTFTNLAAAQLYERVQKEMGKNRRLYHLQIGTFHAVCLTLLKEQGMEFTLIDRAEAQEIAEQVLEAQTYPMSAREFLEAVSRQKAGIEQRVTEEEEWQAVYKSYAEELENRRLLDFDDLLVKTVEKIRSKEMVPGWEKRFSYLLIDEFQDMNPIQMELMWLWRSAGRELFVIGDADQSIYGFRGADAGCFERLKKAMPDVCVIELEENYRSSPEILSAAFAVISGNPGGRQALRANCPSNIPARLVHAQSDMAEAIFIAKEIGSLTGGLGMLEAQRHAEHRQERKVRGFDEIAVLYRTHRQAQLLETCLKKEGIPYIVAGRESFLEEENVQGSIQFFRYIQDRENLCAKEQSLAWLWKLENSVLSEEIVDKTAQRFASLYAQKSPQEFIQLWIEEMGLVENAAMKKLAKMAVFYDKMDDLMQALTFGVESDLRRCGDKEYSAGAVTLMTLHGAKGLEFPAVFICGVKKGCIPLENGKYPVDVEEERRLLYVGMTRAKEELILTFAEEESGFLKILDPGMLKKEEAVRRRKEIGYQQLSLALPGGESEGNNEKTGGIV
ncbi:UvrD-helicase domain-containing protein [Mediterraneibacter massiliensis]|uniref:UvrD-helicase domain-containing protein n=1 Tax=Mediterraneibacter massiliensis TaxID=1720300 RepID=UPI0024AC98BA|nr:UvrD-helicase domain-containing protein [Mediterraneibacter massiliensis]